MSESRSSKVGLAAAVFIMAALAAPRSDAAVHVFEGSAYFTQSVGAFIMGGPFSGVVFEPTKIGPGGSSIVLEHTEAIPVNGGPAPFVLTLLAAHSAAPVMVGGRAFNVSLTLDPAHLSQDGGTITIDGDGSGGTFTVTSDYYVDQTLTSVSGPPTTIVQLAHIVGSASSPGAWSSTPPPGIFLLPGPADSSAAALRANIHPGLLDRDAIDFFATGDLTINETGSLGGSATLTIAATTVPEPATWSLAVIGTGVVGAGLRRRRTAARPVRRIV
jgi:hypothetical protein